MQKKPYDRKLKRIPVDLIPKVDEMITEYELKKHGIKPKKSEKK